MSQYINLKPKGLFTYYNNLSEVDPGSLLKASNVNLDRDGILTPRRGIQYYGPDISLVNSDRVKSLLQYKDTLLRHFKDKIEYDSDDAGNFLPFTGSYLEVVSGERLKSLETKGNFYFATSNGVKKISVKTKSELSTSTPIVTPGAPVALGGSATPNFLTLGFLDSQNQVAYQTTWGYTDSNNLFVEGVPSDPIIANNYSATDNASVDLKIYIPSEVTVNHVYRVYRVQPSNVNVALNFTYNLVFEGNPTSTNISNQYLIYNDFVGESFRNSGEPLYTNSTAEGAFQANYRPPIARDIELFNNSVFYANTKSSQELNITMTSIDDIVDNVTKFTVTSTQSTYSVIFRGSREITQIACQDKAFMTNDSSYFLINSANNERRYLIWYAKTAGSLAPTTDVDGRILVKVDISSITTESPIPSRTQIANATKVAMDIAMGLSSYYDFAITVSALGVITFNNTLNGYCDDAIVATSVPTFFTIPFLSNGTGEDASLGYVLWSDKPTVEEQVAETLKSLVRVMNQFQKDYIFSTTSTSTTPGILTIRAVNLSAPPFYVTTNTEDFALFDFSPSINYELTNTGVTLGSSCTISTAPIAHGLSLGTKVFVYGLQTSAGYKNGLYTVTQYIDSTHFKINLSAVGETLISAGYTTDATDGVSNNNTSINGLYFSKQDQPESVPVVNQILVGSADFPILRIKALRESLFIFKGDGLFRLSGYDTNSFVVQLFDNTVILKCPDSVVSLNNEIFYFGNQGVGKLSEVGKENVSKPIYNLVFPFITTNPNLASATFGLAYESDRSYLLFTVLTASDTYAKVCYRYNVDVDAWTSWDVSKTCGILKKTNDVLYFGSGSDNVLEKERKNFNRFDSADREIALSLPSSGISGNTIQPSNFNIVDEEDVITQTQYVTIWQFNQLLKKLDMDNGFAYNQFYENYQINQGDDLTSKLAALVVKLNELDPSSGYSYDGNPDFQSIQTQYNIIINKLNLSSVAFYVNYPQSVGTTLQECMVITKDTTLKKLTVEKIPPFLQGPLLLYKGIKTEIEFVPQHAGDPSTLKQFSNGSFLFEFRSFYSAKVGFSSDLSMAYDMVKISPISYGNFGDFTWGSGAVWGGLGDRVPLRTYIPAKKQRCRFLGAKFMHGIALQAYSFFGINLTYNVNSERAYR